MMFLRAALLVGTIATMIGTAALAQSATLEPVVTGEATGMPTSLSRSNAALQVIETNRQGDKATTSDGTAHPAKDQIDKGQP